MITEDNKDALKAYKIALRSHNWEDSDYSFYRWIDIECEHEISPKNRTFSEFRSIWNGTAENYSQRMNIEEWEKHREFYRKICSYAQLLS